MELNFQYAHHDFDESDSRVISRADEALKAFDEFDWDTQIQKANDLEKCSPTISLILEPNKHLIWISAFGKDIATGFVSECWFPGEVSKFFGFGKKQGTVSLHAAEISQKDARKALELFIEQDYGNLKALYESA